MTIKYKCQYCDKSSSPESWNEHTEEYFGDGITEIGTAGWESCEFVCPECGEVQLPGMEESK